MNEVTGKNTGKKIVVQDCMALVPVVIPTIDKDGMKDFAALVADGRNQSAGLSKNAKKKAKRAFFVAQKAALLEAIRHGDVRTTGAISHNCARGTYGAVYIANYDKASKTSKVA